MNLKNVKGFWQLKEKIHDIAHLGNSRNISIKLFSFIFVVAYMIA